MVTCAKINPVILFNKLIFKYKVKSGNTIITGGNNCVDKTIILNKEPPVL